MRNAGCIHNICLKIRVIAHFSSDLNHVALVKASWKVNMNVYRIRGMIEIGLEIEENK